MDKAELVKRLMATFLSEVEEHVSALNRDLLTLEKETEAGRRAELLRTLFRTAHSLKGASRSVNIEPLEQLCHQLEEILARVRDDVMPLDPGFFQLLFASADAIGDAGMRLRAGQDLDGGPIAQLLPRLERALLPTGAAKPRPASAPAPNAGPAASAAASNDGSVRVPADKLDTLLAQTGELLVARQRLRGRSDDLVNLQEFVARWHAEWPKTEQALSNERSRATSSLTQQSDNLRWLGKALDRFAASLADDQHALEQTSTALEDEVHRIRMLPFARACEGLDRAVRDLGKTSGKDVELVIEGGDVEIDRSILEGVKDPLLHLVRNAVDHGIELPERRAGAGKGSVGRVTVSAVLRGDRVEVIVADDGAGLNLTAIREQATRRQLDAPDDARALASLIFIPGFSTSPLITELSGRGVGLDVVKTAVESLHGTVDLDLDAPRGTRFVIRLPLTLTTTRVLLIKAGGQTFALPTTSLRRLARIGAEDLRSVKGREMVSGEDGLVPIMSLAEALGLSGKDAPRADGKSPVVFLAAGPAQAAFTVDELLAEQETVVKSLGSRLRRLKSVVGTTTLSTGRLAPILNVGELIDAALHRTPLRSLAASLDTTTKESRKRVLLVDDSVTTRTIERSVLEAAGYEVMVAADGADAWQMLQENGADLVVTDVEMPRMDGFALTQAIRGSSRFKNLPVVLVTGLESEQDKARGLEVGADAHLRKSGFDQKHLLETIAQLL